MSTGRNGFVKDPAGRTGKINNFANRACPPQLGSEVCVQDFGRRHDLPRSEIKRLTLLFGASATAAELIANARARSRVR